MASFVVENGHAKNMVCVHNEIGLHAQNKDTIILSSIANTNKHGGSM